MPGSMRALQPTRELVDAGASGPGAGVVDAGAAAPPADDAGAVDAAILALSDGQILAVADALLAGEIEQARTAEPLLGDPEVLAFAEQTAAEREAARSTLASLATALDVAAEPSALADEVLAENESALQPLAQPDAGALDAAFLSTRALVHGRALERFSALAVAADAPALRAQLVVLEALERSALELVGELSAAP
jgi:predicted outer membrane protein